MAKSGETQCRAFALVPEQEMKMLINNNSLPRVGIEHTTIALQSHPYANCATMAMVNNVYIPIYNFDFYSRKKAVKSYI